MLIHTAIPWIRRGWCIARYALTLKMLASKPSLWLYLVYTVCSVNLVVIDVGSVASNNHLLLNPRLHWHSILFRLVLYIHSSQ